jgi:hypothetical protein
MTRNAMVALSCSSDQGKGVDERFEWKASGVTVGGTGEKIGENAVKTRDSKGGFSGKDSLNCGSVAVFVCYFVFDWWGVSTAPQIRLYAGLLSVLPL